MNSENPKRIVLIGCGKMGGALLKGWLDSGLDAEYGIIEPHDLPEEFSNHDSIRQARTPEELADFARQSDVFVLAIKPQNIPDICGPLKTVMPESALLLSIAAGQVIDNFEMFFSIEQPVIRAMPNTPAAIGQGITVSLANENVTPEQKQLAVQLMEHSGAIEWIEDESLMDTVTALSGSGPAYVFYLIEVMASAGEKLGLEKDLAKKLARQTVIGSAALAASEPDTEASTLRENVTSPAGTTEAALKVLMNGEMEVLFEKALGAAKKRSQQLSS